MQLVSVIARHERRIRLVFSENVYLGNFQPNSGTITVSCTNALGADPAVNARLAIIGSPVAMDLALSQDLVQGGKYTVTITSMLTLTFGQFSDYGSFVWGNGSVSTDVETSTSDRDALLYGSDIVWSGVDYVENDFGDLAELSGAANASQALRRRSVADQLPWDPSYGGAISGYVDGPAASIGILKGSLIRQILLDDRVSEVAVEISTDPMSPETVTLAATASLVGSSGVQDVSISVPVS